MRHSVKQEIKNELKQFTDRLRSTRTAGEFLELIPSSSLVKIAFWLLSALALSPLYILVRSIFLKYHESFYLNNNQSTLGSYWVQYIQIIGYSGLMLTLLQLVKYLVRHNKPGRFAKTLRNHPVPLFLLLMLVWSILSFFFSSNRSLSLHGTSYRNEGLLTYFAYAGIFCCGYMIRDKKLYFILMKIFVLTSTAFSLLMLINNPALNLLLSLEPYAAFFQNINHYGYYLCLAASLAAVLVVKEARLSKAAVFWLVPYAILIAVLIKNSSFGPYLAIVLGLVFLLALSLFYVKNARLCVIVLILIFISLSFGLNLKSNYITYETTVLTEDIADILKNNEKAPQAGSGRWILWTRAVKYTLEKPVFGYGPENLHDRYCLDNLLHDRPHNEILQFSASLGIPAALFYCCALFFFFLPLLKNLKKLSPEIIGTYAAIFSYLASSFVGQTMYCSTSFYFAFLALSCNLISSSGSEPEQNL